MKINYDINTDHHDEPDTELKVVYKDGKKVWPPEDPVDIHDELSKGFARIESVIREEMAKITELIRTEVVRDIVTCDDCEFQSFCKGLKFEFMDGCEDERELEWCSYGERISDEEV